MESARRAVKPSGASDKQGFVLHRETVGPINVQNYYTPEEAIEVGRALIEVGTELLAEQSGDINDEDHRRQWLGDESGG